MYASAAYCECDMTPTGVSATDGRRARRERGRVAVIDAVFELLQQGVYPLSAEAVAEQAEVSVSSVFRYFDGLDDLQRTAIESHSERFAPQFEIPALGQGDLAGRIGRLIESRLDLYEALGPVARLARARALEMEPMAETLASTRLRLAVQIAEHFAPECAALTPARADDLVALIDTLTSFESWDLLQGVHRRSRTQIRRAWQRGLDGLTR